MTRLGILEKTKKKLGQYYTPDQVAVALTDWAIRSVDDRILDPSFGGCAFLKAALSSLVKLGSPRPIEQVFGVDVHDSAWRSIRDLPGAAGNMPNFPLADFFDITPQNFREGRFDAVVGNPPYIRHHSLSTDQVGKAKKATSAGGYEVPRAADYWVYFVFHSLAFLRSGGRLGLVLPTSFLSAKYASGLRSVISSHFNNTKIVLVEERLFKDAQEGTVLVLADGWNQPKHTTFLAVSTAASVAEMSRTASVVERPMPLDGNIPGWKKVLLSDEANSLMERFDRRGDLVQLGSIARIGIGVVTGANDFFVLKPSKASELDIQSRYLTPIIHSSTCLNNLVLATSDVDRLQRDDVESLLLTPPTQVRSQAVARYLRSRMARTARQSSQCKARQPWYVVTNLEPSDALLTYVNGTNARLVLNRARALCTNSVHRVWWKEKLTQQQQRLIALSSMTTLTAVSAEICGRTYGGGVLKLEPSEAARVLVLNPKRIAPLVDSAFTAVCKLLSTGKVDEATQRADEAVLAGLIELTTREITVLRSARDLLRQLR
jgi:adenine-specific DNA-methyltransferase